jgi:nucleolar complex protein 3
MLSRTRKETKRIHALEKERDEMPVARKKRAPSVSSIESLSDYDFDSEVELSDDEERSDVDFGSEGGSDLGEDDEDDEGSEGDSESDQDGLNNEYDGLSDLSSDEDEEDEAPKRKRRAKSEEAEYETAGRARWTQKEEEEADSVEVGRLPIKLPTGEVQLVEGTTRVALPPSKKPKKPEPESRPEEEYESESEGSDDGRDAARMAAQPGRFGRLNIGDIVSAPWKNAQRLEAAKEQLAALGAEVLGGGELVDIAPTLTRLSTFALPSVAATDGEGKLPIPNSIRALAFLSQLAVFKDIIPGYSIRPLTAAEEAEKVRDEVRRQREGEKMLVRNYKSYLRMLEIEIKGESVGWAS